MSTTGLYQPGSVASETEETRPLVKLNTLCLVWQKVFFFNVILRTLRICMQLSTLAAKLSTADVMFNSQEET